MPMSCVSVWHARTGLVLREHAVGEHVLEGAGEDREQHEDRAEWVRVPLARPLPICESPSTLDQSESAAL